MTAMAPTRPNPASSSSSRPAGYTGPRAWLAGQDEERTSLLLPISGRRCRVPIVANLAAAAAARAVVAEAIRTWHVPVDPEVAVLLASELMTNAVTHGTLSAAQSATPTRGAFVLLTIACDAAGLRVEVHDGSADLPVPHPRRPSAGAPVNGGIASAAQAATGPIRAAVAADAASDQANADALAESGRGLVLVATLSDEWGFYRTPSGKAVYFTLHLRRPSTSTSTRADLTNFE